MRVGVNGRTLSTQSLRGWSRYTLNLFREMSHQGVFIVLFSDRPIHDEWLEGFHQENLLVDVVEGWNYLDWEQNILPRLIQKHQLDIYHCPVHYGVPLRRTSAKKVLTLHDAIEVAYYDRQLSWRQKISWRRYYARFLNRVSRRAADHVITVSQASKNDIQYYYHVPSDDISVVYEAADSIFQMENTLPRKDLTKVFSIKKPYFFYIGGLEGRKNIPFLVRSFSQLKTSEYDLVLAGGSSEDIKSTMELASSLGCRDQVRCLGKVEEHFLPTLYRYAHCFVYPSLYEGFGLQLLEAMQMRCPLLVSQVTSLPEIANYKDSHFDPTEQSSLVEKMKKTIEDPIFLETLVEAGDRRVKNFLWSATAKKTIEVYKKLL